MKSGAWNFTQLFVNGERRNRPRLPKSGYFKVAGFAGFDPNGKYNTPMNKFNYAEGDIRPNWTNIQDIETIVLHFWVDTHLQIAGIDEATKTVTFDRFSRRKFTDDHSSKGARYYLSNIYKALDTPGEFYLNAKTGVLHYIPKPGEDLEKAEVIAPRLSSLVRFAGNPKSGQFVDHISLQGLTFSDVEWQLPKKDGGDTQAAEMVPAVISAEGARNCAIRDCVVRNSATYGIELGSGCKENQIIRNELCNLGAGGIKLSGGGVGSPEAEQTAKTQITDNHIHDCGQIFHSAVGILLRHSAGNTVAHNHIHHLYYTAISIGWVWGYKPSISRDNIVEFNHIHDIGQKVLSDMGGIYMLGVSPGTVIRNNLLHDIDSWGYGGWGIYTDEGSSEIVIENNVVYRTKSGGFHQHYGRENIVRNNVFALAREEQVARSRAESHVSFTFERNIVYFAEGPLLGKNWKDDKFKLDYNVYFHAGGKPIAFPGGTFQDWKKRGFDQNSIIADPMFNDPAKGDFSLKPDSPAFKLGFKAIDISKVGPRK